MVEILLWKKRKEKGLTLRQLEEVTGISKSTLGNIENQMTSPTIDEMEIIANALDCAIDDLYAER